MSPHPVFKESSVLRLALTLAAGLRRAPFAALPRCLSLLLVGLMAPAWASLPIEHWQQPSGARVYLVRSPSIPMLDVQVDFDAGLRREPAQQIGLASAMANLLSKGVLAHGQDGALDENAITEAWVDLGASFSASASADQHALPERGLRHELAREGHRDEKRRPHDGAADAVRGSLRQLRPACIVGAARHHRSQHRHRTDVEHRAQAVCAVQGPATCLRRAERVHAQLHRGQPRRLLGRGPQQQHCREERAEDLRALEATGKPLRLAGQKRQRNGDPGNGGKQQADVAAGAQQRKQHEQRKTRRSDRGQKRAAASQRAEFGEPDQQQDPGGNARQRRAQLCMPHLRMVRCSMVRKIRLSTSRPMMITVNRPAKTAGMSSRFLFS